MSWFKAADGQANNQPAKLSGKVEITDHSRGDRGQVIGNNDTTPPGNVTTWFGF